MNVWITGASSGIGQATAYSFASRGHRVILTALEAPELYTTAEECRKKGAPDVKCLPFNLLDTKDIPTLAEQAWNASLPIEVTELGMSMLVSPLQP